MFQPRPTVRLQPLGGSAPPCVVIDDVLAEPQALVDAALRHRDAFAPAAANAFPGLELPLPDAVVDRFAECFAQHARSRLSARRVLQATGRLSMVTFREAQLSPLQRVCHRDRLAASADECVAAGVLYLFHDPALGGTSFFRPRGSAEATEALMQRWAHADSAAFERETGWPPGYMTRSNQHFECVAEVPARWNRLIFYDGSHFHGSHITQPALLDDDPARGRLTINLFFLCSRRGAGA